MENGKEEINTIIEKEVADIRRKINGCKSMRMDMMTLKFDILEVKLWFHGWCNYLRKTKILNIYTGK